MPSPRRRLLLRLGAAVAVLSVAAGAAWCGWLWYDAPVPPAVPLDGLESAAAEAVAAARERARREGRSSAAWGEYGKVLRANGFDAASDVCFARAERLDPREPRWPYYQGLTLLSRSPEAALPFLRRAVERADASDPGNPAPRLLLAETLLRAEAYDEAAGQLDRAPETPDGRAEYDRGLLAEARGDDVEAARHFTAAAAGPSARQKACAALAAIRLRQGDAPAATVFSRRAADPPDDQPWDDLYMMEYSRLQGGRKGRLAQADELEKDGRPEEALAILRGLAEESDGDAQGAAGDLLYRLGRLEEAEAYFRKAAAGTTNQTQANYSLAVVLSDEAARLRGRPDGGPEAARAKLREAAACLDRALELKPDYGLAHLTRGLVREQLGERPEAIASFRRAVLLRPELAAAHLALGEALADDGRKAEAVAELQKACDLAGPDDPRPRDALARARGDKP